ncbi:MAG: hypothetical protein HUU10_03865 [Bacteroidetes bacterium]|nr:hypothetical protein [Bacteroidota bacterium]
MILLADVGRSKTHWSVNDTEGRVIRSSRWEGRQAVLSEPYKWLKETGSASFDGMVLGLAGLTALSSAEKTVLETCLKTWIRPEGHLVLCTDADLISACLLPESLAVSLGSGSVLIQSGREGSTRITGGWGPKFGDELGAGWWWIQLVRHVMLVAEGRKPTDAVSVWMEKQIGSGGRELLAVALQTSDEKAMQMAGEFLTESPDPAWISSTFSSGWQSLMTGIRWNQYRHVYFQGGLTGIPVIHQLILDHFLQSGVEHAPTRIDNLLKGAWFLWQHRSVC